MTIQALQKRTGFVPFAQGLRPFFLLAGLDAIFNMAVWLFVWFDPQLWPSASASIYWHGHEMIFGFVAAAIGGFLLTAVPGWTGRSSYAGAPLILLSAIWLAGRVALFPRSDFPAGSAAIVDLAFFPALAVTLAPSLIRAGKLRNLPFLALLAALFACNLLFHLGRLGLLNGGELRGLDLAVDVVVVLIAVVGGRIIPVFTQSGMMRRDVRIDIARSVLLERLAIASLIAVLLGDCLAPRSAANGLVALVASALHFARWLQWEGRRTLKEPLIWVLHAGYVWIVVGLLMKGLWLTLALGPAAKWLHALTAGAFATMILAVMTRASLGHTGRALKAPKPMTACYLLVMAAAILRVFGPAVVPDYYGATIAVAGACWIGAFTLFVVVYAPILTRPRADGRPG